MPIRALTFDAFGTLVDWRGSILAELEALDARLGIAVDWPRFLADWKSCYREGMDKVNAGAWPWTTVEVIYHRRLVELLQTYRIGGMEEAEVDHLNHVWWRLRPWPDVVVGLGRLKAHYVLSPLSNASFAGMVHLGKFAGLPWDCVITAENARCYKPRPQSLPDGDGAAGSARRRDHDGGRPQLRSPRGPGAGHAYRFIPRPSEYGPGQVTDLTPEGDWDIVATDVENLARVLGT